MVLQLNAGRCWIGACPCARRCQYRHHKHRIQDLSTSSQRESTNACMCLVCTSFGECTQTFISGSNEPAKRVIKSMALHLVRYRDGCSASVRIWLRQNVPSTIPFVCCDTDWRFLVVRSRERPRHQVPFWSRGLCFDPREWRLRQWASICVWGMYIN
jgi:hypothetical protein